MTEAIAEPVWVLPCGFDNQWGNIERCAEFFGLVAARERASGFETSHGDDDLNRLVDHAVDCLGSDDAGPLAQEFSNRLAIDLLLQAAAHEPETTIDWWPVFAEAKEGDLMLLLLSPAPIPRSILDEIAANDGRVAESQALMRELVDPPIGAKMYGERVDPGSFDDLRLDPFRRFAGGGLFGFGRLMADPKVSKDGAVGAPVGQLEPFQRAVNPVELGWPSMNHRLESGEPYWSVNRSGAREACFVEANSSEVRAKVNETIVGVPSVVEFEPPVASSGWNTGQVDLPEGFKLIRQLGAGGNGEVFLVSSGNSELVLKRLDHVFDGSDTQIALEASELPELQDERLVWYEESFAFAGKTWLRMPFRGHSLQSMRTGMSLAAVLGVLVDLGEALALVHKAGYSWGDIKPLNTLVDGNGRGHLADPDLLNKPTKSGTPAYMSQDPDFFNDDLLAFVRTSLVALEGTFRMEQGEQIALSPDRPPSWVEPGSLDAREWQVLVDDFGLGQAWVKPGERPSTAPGTIDEATELLRTAKKGVERWRLATETDLAIAQDLVKDRV